MMKWEQLLSLNRQGDTTKRLRVEQDDTRLGFDVDNDRVVFSSAFRSLQDKTQVIPLSKTDFVHTRLTHSLEVSVVGRSLGRLIGKEIIKKHPYLEEVYGHTMTDFGTIVAAASLAHDIGNPPFGHSGEKAIGEYFKIGKGLKYKDQLSAIEWQDLIDFEGNANGFSVLTSSRPGIEGSVRLTYATLGAFMKYPKESLPKKPTKEIQDKKFGYFQGDKQTFLDIATELGLIPNGSGDEIRFKRHPLAFVVEAADDICYTIIDFEDGINMGWISEDLALEYLIKLVQQNIDSKKFATLITTEDRLSYLRALAINSLIQDAVKIFLENETAILNGEFTQALMEKSKYKAQLNDILKVCSDKIYNSKEVIEKELVGYQVINDLLDKFCTAFNNKSTGQETSYDQLILRMLPEKYSIEKLNLYDRLMHICHFVSMLSDGKALELYKVLNGK